MLRPITRRWGICFRSTQRYTVCGLTPRKLAASGTVQGCSLPSLGVWIFISTKVFFFMVFLCHRPRALCYRFVPERFFAVTLPEPSSLYAEHNNLDWLYLPRGNRRCAGLLLRGHRRGRGRVSRRPNRVRIGFCGHWASFAAVVGTRQSVEVLRVSLRLL